MAEVRFFDAVTSAEVTTALRQNWREHHMEEHPWDGHLSAQRAPQLLAEVDARRDSLRMGALSQRQEKIAARLFDPRRGARKKVFGGFSGGPIVVVTPDGEFLIAIIKQGGWVFDRLSVAASCWDDCLHAFGRWAAKAKKRAPRTRKNRVLRRNSTT